MAEVANAGEDHGNAALVGGTIPSSAGNYSGGGENFIRLTEDWKNNTMCIYGSMVELYKSTQAVAPWNGAGGIGGFFKRTFAPKGLGRIHEALIDRLERSVSTG